MIDPPIDRIFCMDEKPIILKMFFQDGRNRLLWGGYILQDLAYRIIPRDWDKIGLQQIKHRAGKYDKTGHLSCGTKNNNNEFVRVSAYASIIGIKNSQNQFCQEWMLFFIMFFTCHALIIDYKNKTDDNTYQKPHDGIYPKMEFPFLYG